MLSAGKKLYRPVLSMLVVSVLVAGPLVVPAGPAMAQPSPCPAEGASEPAALAAAALCGGPVPVGPSRSEFTQVLAQPDGRLVLESAVVPQRARRSDGRWANLDLDLGKGGDGLWRPAVSVADVAFSGGGNGPLMTLRRAGGVLTLSWPQPLPEPVVSGESATYRLSADLDLVVRATWTGFTHVLVIKSPQAAADPMVRAVRLRLGGDAVVRNLPNGSLTAVAADGGQVAFAERPVMWDSTPVGVSANASDVSIASTVPDTELGSSATGPSDAAMVAPVTAEVSGDGAELVLRPDQSLLSSPDAHWPIFVDPAWSVAKMKWAYATNDGSSNTDYSMARVGLNPDTGALYRSFFEFSTTSGAVSLKGKHIRSAYVRMKLYHSWSCNGTWTHLYGTRAINNTMKASWSTMTLDAWMGAEASHANKGSGCADSPQPDMVVNFDGASVTSRVRRAADSRWNSIAVGLSAGNSAGEYESAQDRWKKWYPNEAVLIVDYDSVPGAPSGSQVAGVACPSSGTLTVGTLSPTLSAVLPDADTGQTITGTFEWVEVPTGGVGAITDSFPARLSAPSPPQAPAGGRATTAALSGAAEDRTYAFRARGTDPAPYSLTGPWSGWCQFTVDTTRPPVSVTAVTVPPGPGEAGTFRIESTASDVTSFKYGWGAASTSVAASGTPKSATVSLTAPKFGVNVLHVAAVDEALNEGVGSVEFMVGRPSSPVASWGLESYPGVDQAAALADRQPGLAGETPLTATNVAWASDARLVGGATIGVDGSGYLEAPGPVVDTTKSFSVAAWARLASTGGGDHTVASIVAPSAFRFALYFDGTTGLWTTYMPAGDPPVPGGSVAAGPAAVAGRWTHLAGVYDATEKTLSLYVNGVPVKTVAHSASWATTGKFNVGRTTLSGATHSPFVGEIADVQVFDRVLVPQDFTGQLASDPESGGFDEPGFLTPIEAGTWHFDNAESTCYVANLHDSCQARDSSPWGRWLATTRGSASGAGHVASGNGLWLDDDYFPEEGYTESTQEYGRSAFKTGVTPPDAEGNEFTLWQDTPVLKTDQSLTVSTWVVTDDLSRMSTAVSQMGVHDSAFRLKLDSITGKWQFVVRYEDSIPSVGTAISSSSLAEAGVWTHLAGVYDAEASCIHIYVNGVLEGTASASTPFVSSGPLLAGRTLWRDGLVDQWTGGVDEVRVFQGALTDAAVKTLYESTTG